jgi:phenol hydroxylase P5 protein
MTYELTIEPLGETIEVEEDQTLLDAALRAGIWLPHACCHGLCATCKVQVVEGEVEIGEEASPFALMDFEREEGMALACCSTALSDVVIEADVDEDPDAVIRPVEDYQGTVTRLVDLTPTAKGVFIELDGEGLEFQAGQYVNLELPDIELPRAFSMANSPAETNVLELNIRRVPGGAATSYVHDQLQEGDRVRLAGPYGRFFIRKSAMENVLLLAGGTGLSSIKSMLLDLLDDESQAGKSIKLVYGARDRSELYYDDLLRELAGRHERFTYVPALSEAKEQDDWSGATGFVHDVAREHFDGDFRGHKAYMCGPPVMIDACITTLMQGRLFERDMFMERFFSAADSAQNIRKSPLFKSI